MILEKLDAAYARNPDPDAVQAALYDPFATFIRCNELTEELWNSIPADYEVCYYCISGKCWDREQDVKNVTRFPRKGAPYQPQFSNPSWYADFAVIGYQHRFNADPKSLYE